MDMKTQHTHIPWSMYFTPLKRTDSGIEPSSGQINYKTDKVIFGRPVYDTIAFLIHCYDEKTQDVTKANAEFIVKAVNSHYELLEALKKAVKYLHAHNMPLMATHLEQAIQNAQ